MTKLIKKKMSLTLGDLGAAETFQFLADVRNMKEEDVPVYTTSTGHRHGSGSVAVCNVLPVVGNSKELQFFNPHFMDSSQGVRRVKLTATVVEDVSDGLEDLDPEKHMVYSETHGFGIVSRSKHSGDLFVQAGCDIFSVLDLDSLRANNFVRVEKPKTVKQV